MVPDVGEVCFGKILLPSEGNVAALYNQVLLILDGGLDHFTDDGPQAGSQFLVAAGGGELGVPTADQPHFQVIDGEIGIMEFFQQLLGEKGLSGMGSAGNQ